MRACLQIPLLPDQARALVRHLRGLVGLVQRGQRGQIAPTQEDLSSREPEFPLLHVFPRGGRYSYILMYFCNPPAEELLIGVLHINLSWRADRFPEVRL